MEGFPVDDPLAQKECGEFNLFCEDDDGNAFVARWEWNRDFGFYEALYDKPHDDDLCEYMTREECIRDARDYGYEDA